MATFLTSPAHAAAAAVFAVTFVLLALGRIGPYPLKRGPTAFAGGAVTALLLGIVPGPATIDADVLLLLAGLMAMAGLCAATGLFFPLQVAIARLRPAPALGVALAATGLVSAALLNDAAVVVLVPILLPPLRSLGLPMVPVVTLIAVAANAGSLLTPFGNPQNAVLAHAGGLGVADFLVVQGPVVLLAAASLAFACLWYARRATTPVQGEWAPATGTRTARKVAVAGIAFFLAAATLAPRAGVGLGAAAAASALLLAAALAPSIGRQAPRSAFKGIDWNVLLLFVGLYLLTAGLPHWFPAAWVPQAWLDTPAGAAAVTLGVSNAIGNVPATLVLQRLVPEWTALHAPFLVTVTTMGGALLLTGSAASLIAADVARSQGVEVRFLPFLRHAVPWVAPGLLLGAWLTW